MQVLAPTAAQTDPRCSWFLKVKEICLKYHLPEPLSVLSHPPSATSFKQTTKQKVLHFWNSKLRVDARRLDSLDMFRPDFMSLCQPHPIWTSAGSSPFEVRKATVQARMQFLAVQMYLVPFNTFQRGSVQDLLQYFLELLHSGRTFLSRIQFSSQLSSNRV